MNITNRTIETLTLFAISAAILGGCGKDVDKAVKSVKQAARSIPLSNTWQEEECRGAAGFWGASVRTFYEFNAQNVNKTNVYYSDAECRDKSISATFSGTTHIGNEIYENTKEIDVTLNSAVVTPHTETARDHLNSISACSISNWVINHPQDVTAHSGGLSCLHKQLPDTTYDIYVIENDNLLFGTGSNKGTPDRRPQELNRSKVYHKL